MTKYSPTVHEQATVTVYLKRKQLLLFAFAAHAKQQ